MSFGTPDRFPDSPKVHSRNMSNGINTFEWTFPVVTAAATGATDWIDTRGFRSVSFYLIGAAGTGSATVAIRGAMTGGATDANGDPKPLAAEFLGVNATDETGTTAATATVAAGASKILSVPDVHRAVGYWQVNVSANTLSGSLTIRAIAESDS